MLQKNSKGSLTEIYDVVFKKYLDQKPRVFESRLIQFTMFLGLFEYFVLKIRFAYYVVLSYYFLSVELFMIYRAIGLFLLFLFIGMVLLFNLAVSHLTKTKSFKNLMGLIYRCSYGQKEQFCRGKL